MKKKEEFNTRAEVIQILRRRKIEKVITVYYKHQYGDSVDIYSFTTCLADSLLEEKSSLTTFYATEAADGDLDMKVIVKILNEKGDKVKDS